MAGDAVSDDPSKKYVWISLKDSLLLYCSSEQNMEQKFKPFDWTFTSTYQGTLNEKFRSEPTEQTLNKMKLMQRENILFYHDLTLYEDELHDHGISVMSVRIVSVMILWADRGVAI